MTSPFAVFRDDLCYPLVGRLDANGFDAMLLWAFENRVSDIKAKSGDVLRVRVGGGWTQVTQRPLSHPEVEDIVRGTYGPNGPAELRDGNPLDYSHHVRPPGERFGLPFRVNATGCRIMGGSGLEVTVRSLPQHPPLWKDLDIEDDITANLRPPGGLNVFSGSTGAGKSTLLSSGIRLLCEDSVRRESVLEISAPIEYVHYGLAYPNSFVTQSEVGIDVNPRHLSDRTAIWRHALSNAMRRQPDILVIGEVRDRDGMRGCLEAPLTGHLTMTTMHAPGAPETIARAIQWFARDEQQAIAINLLDTLNMVVHQRLVPRADGKRKVGVREYIIFDTSLKAMLVRLPHEEWPARMREMLRKRLIIGRSASDSLRLLRRAGTITQDTYEWAAAMSGESRLVRAAEALGSDREERQE